MRNPWVCAAACLINFLGDKGYQAAQSLFPEKAAEITIIKKMIEGNINSPQASSCGRLFDAVAAILGICKVNTYDGQAAIELGETVNKEWVGVGGMSPIYPYTITGDVIDPALMFEAILKDLQAGVPVRSIIFRFHYTVAAMVVEGAERARNKKGINSVVLSGGCWHNKYFFEITRQLLLIKGFNVHYHRIVPPGDGGISLGQAMVGYTLWKKLEEG